MTDNIAASRLGQQVQFIVEIDKLKRVLRRNYHVDQSRRENSAEHSWHLAVTALLLQEHADGRGLDVLRVLKMILAHDIVEIDAGDSFVYDDAAAADKAEREVTAAERIFALLPTDQANEVRALWDEFEAKTTPEARFAGALDRLLPLLMNYSTQGRAWREHGINVAQVLSKNRAIISEASLVLGAYAVRLIMDAVAKGYLQAPPEQ